MVHGEGSAGPSPSDLTLCHNIDFGRARFQDGPHVKVGPCGAGLCATIASPKSTVDPETGQRQAPPDLRLWAYRSRSLRSHADAAICRASIGDDASGLVP